MFEIIGIVGGFLGKYLLEGVPPTIDGIQQVEKRVADTVGGAANWLARKTIDVEVRFGQFNRWNGDGHAATQWYRAAANGVRSAKSTAESNGDLLTSAIATADGMAGIASDLAKGGRPSEAITLLMESLEQLRFAQSVFGADYLYRDVELVRGRIAGFNTGDQLLAVSGEYALSEEARIRGDMNEATRHAEAGLDLANITYRSHSDGAMDGFEAERIIARKIDAWQKVLGEQAEFLKSGGERPLASNPSDMLLEVLYQNAGCGPLNRGSGEGEGLAGFIKWILDNNILPEPTVQEIVNASKEGASDLLIARRLSDAIRVETERVISALAEHGGEPLLVYLYENKGKGPNADQLNRIGKDMEARAARREGSAGAIYAVDDYLRAYAAYETAGVDTGVSIHEAQGRLVASLWRLSAGERNEAFERIHKFLQQFFVVNSGKGYSAVALLVGRLEREMADVSGIDSSVSLSWVRLHEAAGELNFTGRDFYDFLGFAHEKLGYQEVYRALAIATEAKVSPGEFQESVVRYLTARIEHRGVEIRTMAGSDARATRELAILTGDRKAARMLVDAARFSSLKGLSKSLRSTIENAKQKFGELDPAFVRERLALYNGSRTGGTSEITGANDLLLNVLTNGLLAIERMAEFNNLPPQELFEVLLAANRAYEESGYGGLHDLREVALQRALSAARETVRTSRTTAADRGAEGRGDGRDGRAREGAKDGRAVRPLGR